MLPITQDYVPPHPWKTRFSRHWKRAAWVFAALFGFISVVTLLMPKKYESSLKFLVTNERVNPLVSLNGQTTGLLYLDEISAERVNTETQLLTSTNILRQLVARYHLEDSVGHHGAPLAARRQMALQDLQRNLKVQAVRQSNVIDVSYENRNPVLAANVLRTLSDLYLKAHIQLNSAPGSSKVFRQLADEYTAELAQAENRLVQFRQAHHIVALPEEKTLAIQRQTELEKQLLDSNASERQESKEAGSLQRSLTKLPPNLVLEQRAIPNQYSIERLNTMLVDLENKRAERAALYKPDDRMIRDLDVQIERTRAASNAANTHTSEELSKGINPTYQSVHAQLLQLNASSAGYKARSLALASQLGMSQARLEDLDQATASYDDLQRNVKEMEELSSLYKNKAEEAAASEALDRQRIANVAVAESPYVSYIPASPRTRLILSLGFIWSLLIAAGVVFVSDHFNKLIYNQYELEQVISVPLLATLPSGTQPPQYGGAFSGVLTSMYQPSAKSEGRI